MFWQKEPKNLGIIIFIILACLVAGTALFIYTTEKPSPETTAPAGIEVIETKEGKIIRNKTEGYEVTVSKGWNVERPSAGYLSFNDIDWDNPKDEYCKIETYIIDNPQKLTAEQWLNREEVKLNESFLTINLDERVEVNIDGQRGIKRVLDTNETGYSIAVIVPLRQKIYELILYPKGEDKERCLKDFDLYLSSIKF
ncbi:MAG: hypothetical protein N2259_01365 [Patescibacteria group bacterium]|nr:hypothetical protein [Patescibacteria group bacterium]